MASYSEVEYNTTNYCGIGSNGMISIEPGVYYISGGIYCKYTSSCTDANVITIAIRDASGGEYNICNVLYTNTDSFTGKSNAGPQLSGRLIAFSKSTTIGLYVRSRSVPMTVSGGNAATYLNIIRFPDTFSH